MAAQRKYPDELRERAIRTYLESSPRPPIRRLADQLGVHPEALRNWIRRAQAPSAVREERDGTAENPELARMRKEISDLRRANEILKAANEFLAQQVDPSSLRS